MAVAGLSSCTAVVLDVAGTTTSLSFVKDTLLPYASKHVEAYLRANWSSANVSDAVKIILAGSDLIDKDADLSSVDENLGLAVAAFEKARGAAAVAKVDGESEADALETAVKQIEGLVYAAGYADGTLRGHVFDDVPTVLKQWSSTQKPKEESSTNLQKRMRVAIYSTGSIDSQRLLFANTSAGIDLTPLISHFFDTRSIGSKTNALSYEKLAKEIGCPISEMVFVTDNVAEARAAREAGAQTVLVEREGNAELGADERSEFRVVGSLAELDFPSSNADAQGVKRKAEEDTAAEGEEAKAEKEDEKRAKLDEEAAEVTKTEKEQDLDVKTAANDNTVEKRKTENVVGTKAENGEKAVEEKKDEEVKTDPGEKMETDAGEKMAMENGVEGQVETMEERKEQEAEVTTTSEIAPTEAEGEKKETSEAIKQEENGSAEKKQELEEKTEKKDAIDASSVEQEKQNGGEKGEVEEKEEAKTVEEEKVEKVVAVKENGDVSKVESTTPEANDEPVKMKLNGDSEAVAAAE